MQRIGALTEKIGIHATSQRFQCVSPGDAEQALPPLQQFNPCEICGHIADVHWDFLRKFQNTLIVDGEERRRFSNNRGLCGFHTWQLELVASDYGLCMTYPDVLERLATWLRAEAQGPKPREERRTESGRFSPEMEAASCARSKHKRKLRPFPPCRPTGLRRRAGDGVAFRHLSSPFRRTHWRLARSPGRPPVCSITRRRFTSVFQRTCAATRCGTMRDGALTTATRTKAPQKERC